MRLEKTLERLTNNPVKGLALGAGVTAVIQSSAATSVMAVGFVNAGIMKLGQAVPVVMGANIGTTMTAQILRLGDISSDNLLLTLLKPASFAPLFIAWEPLACSWQSATRPWIFPPFLLALAFSLWA